MAFNATIGVGSYELEIPGLDQTRGVLQIDGAAPADRRNVDIAAIDDIEREVCKIETESKAGKGELIVAGLVKIGDDAV